MQKFILVGTLACSSLLAGCFGGAGSAAGTAAALVFLADGVEKRPAV